MSLLSKYHQKTDIREQLRLTELLELLEMEIIAKRTFSPLREINTCKHIYMMYIIFS